MQRKDLENTTEAISQRNWSRLKRGEKKMQITHNHKSKHKRQHTTTPLNRQQTPDKQSLFHSWTQPLPSFKQTTNIHTPITRNLLVCFLQEQETENRNRNMGIRVKQFKEIDYPQPHTGKENTTQNTNHNKTLRAGTKKTGQRRKETGQFGNGKKKVKAREKHARKNTQ